MKVMITMMKSKMQIINKKKKGKKKKIRATTLTSHMTCRQKTTVILTRKYKYNIDNTKNNNKNFKMTIKQ